MVARRPRLTEAQLRTELDLVTRLHEHGLTLERRHVNVERDPYFIEGHVGELHVWMYDDGGASVVGPNADLMIEMEDFAGRAELRAAVVDAVLRLST